MAKKSERLGNVDGIWLVAEFYSKGIGVKANPRKAASLYEHAAKLGSPLAQYQYALCLAAGNPTQANMVACRQWMSISSSNGFEGATNFLEQPNEFQMADVRGWLNSMTSDNWVNDLMQDRIYDFNTDLERSSQLMRQRLGY